MTMIPKALHTIISGDAGIIAELSTYDFGSGDAPAIFTTKLDDAPTPHIRIQQVSGSHWGCRANKGGLVILDVLVVGDKTTSDKALLDIANDVWDVVNRASLTLSGGEAWGCLADPPNRLTDEEGFPVYQIGTTVRFLLT